MRRSLRLPLVLALVAALAGIRPDPAAAEADRALVEVTSQYICWEALPKPRPPRLSAPTYQRCDVPLTLSKPSKDEIVVTYQTEPGTATPDKDYVHVRAAKVVIRPGETAGHATVLIVPDEIPEPDETFFVLLLEATGADIGEKVGKVTISGDDPPKN